MKPSITPPLPMAVPLDLVLPWIGLLGAVLMASPLPLLPGMDCIAPPNLPTTGCDFILLGPLVAMATLPFMLVLFMSCSLGLLFDLNDFRCGDGGDQCLTDIHGVFQCEWTDAAEDAQHDQRLTIGAVCSMNFDGIRAFFDRWQRAMFLAMTIMRGRCRFHHRPNAVLADTTSAARV